MSEGTAEAKDGQEVTAPVERGKAGRFPKKKILALVVVAVIVIASVSTIWYFYFRHWSPQELADKMVRDGYGGLSGFKSSLAGKSVIVEGKVTKVESFETTLETVTVIELDNVQESSLVFWDPVLYEVGDTIERKVSFERAFWNDDELVMSPQVWLPFGYAYSGALMRHAISYMSSDGGNVEVSNQGNDVIISVDWLGEPAKLEDANCTLAAGNRSGFIDVLELGDNYKVYQTDSIHDLTNEIGENQTIEFSDENSDGYLDNGDQFILRNLSRPDTESGIKSYALHVGWPVDPDREYYEIHGFSCYIPVRIDGAVFPRWSVTPIVRGHVGPYDGAITLTIDHTETSVPWDSVSVMISDGTNFATWQPTLGDPAVGSIGVRTLGMLDVDLNITHMMGGIVGVGDVITFSAAGSGQFSPSTVYLLLLVYEPSGTQMLRKEVGTSDFPVARLEPYLAPVDGFGFSFTSVHVGVNNSYRPFDLGWDDVSVNLSDGVNNITWTPVGIMLHLGNGSATYENISLGSLTVQLFARDLNVDLQINYGDRLELRTPEASDFSSSTTYTVTVIYSSTDATICSASFNG